MTVKRHLRNVLWWVRGPTIRNPPVPDAVRSVLFVCHGNICRSPFAERSALAYLARTAAHGSMRVKSAGLHASQAARPPQDAIDAALRRGIDLTGHEPVAVTRELLEAFDVVVAMEPAHLAALRTLWPEASERYFLLPLFERSVSGPFDRCHLPDPFGKAPAEFERCYGRIDRAVVAFVDAIRPSSP